MDKKTTHMRVSYDAPTRFKKIAYMHGMSMIEFMNVLLDKFEEKKVKIEP